MSKINQIQTAILSLDPGAYQKLMDSYVMKMQFVEHRAHISEKIRNLQERKEDVLLREFLEER